MKYEVIFRDEFDYTMMDRSFEEFDTLEDACEYIENMLDNDGCDDMVNDGLNVWHNYTRIVDDVSGEEYEERASYLIRIK